MGWICTTCMNKYTVFICSEYCSCLHFLWSLWHIYSGYRKVCASPDSHRIYKYMYMCCALLMSICVYIWTVDLINGHGAKNLHLSQLIWTILCNWPPSKHGLIDCCIIYAVRVFDIVLVDFVRAVFVVCVFGDLVKLCWKTNALSWSALGHKCLWLHSHKSQRTTIFHTHIHNTIRIIWRSYEQAQPWINTCEHTLTMENVFISRVSPKPRETESQIFINNAFIGSICNKFTPQAPTTLHVHLVKIYL